MTPHSVIINGDVMLYEAKAPFKTSGSSIFGGLEYDPEEDKVKCHECGHWFRSIGSHLSVHGITPDEYRLKHGLKLRAALCSEHVRETRIRVAQRHLVPWSLGHKNFHRKLARKLSTAKLGTKRKRRVPMETLNARGQCPEQQIHRLHNLAKRLGRTPTYFEIREDGISLRTLQWTFGSVAKALEIAGLSFRVVGTKPQAFTKDQVIALLRNFVATHQRRPTYSDQRRGLLPTQGVYDRLWVGGWPEALKAAGITVRALQTRTMSDVQLLNGLQNVCIKLGRAPMIKEDLRAYGLPHQSTYVRRFGSWKNALSKVHFVPNSKGFHQ